ncbi:amino acid adenylation domain-containing protein, partial [Micromonospora sp. URMC 107]|uniref:non-ribosomal peptide synthetase n=1 Tax=Micromonospora sp. URMC 107 TaxID=3423418 RepID=UPI003F195162
DPTFRELLARVRETTLGAYAHQDLPFERLVQELAPNRDLAHGVPLFNVDLMLQNAPFPHHDLGDLQVTIEDRDTGTAKSDLGLMFWESVEDGRPQLVGWYEYSTDLFDETTVRCLVEQMLAVLDHATTQPDVRLSELSMMDDESVRIVLPAARGRRTEPDAFTSVLDMFTATVRTHGRRPALVMDGVTCDYEELDRRANRLAAGLLAAGVRPDDRVAVFARRSIGSLVAVLGVLKAGGAFAMVDTDTPSRRLTALLDSLAPRVVVTDGTAPLPEGCAVPTLPVPAVDEQLAAAPAVAPPPHATAYVMHTSGSTGTPKGVLIEHRSLSNLTRWLDDVIHRTAERGAPVATFNADFTSDAFVEDLCLLFLGATMHIPDAMLRRDPAGLAAFVRAHGVQFLQCSPTQMQQLLDRDLFGADSPLERVVVAGEAVSQALWDRLARLDAEVWNVYGPTECTVDATAVRIEPDRVSTIGRPIDNVDIVILDSLGRLVPVGVRGEICIGGPQVGRGYAGRPRQTADVFVPDPRPSHPGARLYRTGDVGAYRADGTIAFHGRADHQVKLHGHRVELGDVESALARCEGVADVRAVVGTGADGGDVLVAYAVPHRDRLLSESTDLLRSWEEVFDAQQGIAHTGAADFDLAGWNDTASSRQIADDEMRQWRDATVRRILRLDPSDVLEIGCGTGLIMLPLLAHVRSFAGVDISAATLDKLARVVADQGQDDRVSLHRAHAADLDGLGGRRFDVAILNSVVQYFPTAAYLGEVLDAVRARLHPAGRIFLGDLRPRESLVLTHLWIESVRGGRQLTLGELDRRCRRAVEAERELLVSAVDLVRAAGDGAWVDHDLHEGRGANELVRFRYDATVHRAPADLVVTPRWQDWSEGWDPQRLFADPSATLGVRGIPNARLRRERALLAALGTAPEGTTVGQALEESTEPDGVDPQDVFDLAARAGRAVRTRWTPGRIDGVFDVVVLPGSAAGRRVAIADFDRDGMDGTAAASDPLKVHARARLVAELRACATRELPQHMVPARFVLIDRIPVDRAGKLDVRALPKPYDEPAAPTSTGEPPAGPVEVALAGIWERLLGVRGVTATDDFFHLGGHSILATQLVNRVNDLFACGLTLRDPFERPVLRALAGRIGELLADATSGLPLLPVLRRRHMPPSFAQERLWLVDQLGGSAAYNIPHALR